MKVTDAIETTLIPFGVALGLANIQEVLGIVLLCLQVVILIYKVGYSVYKKIKTKKYDEVDEELEEGAQALQNLIDSTKEDDKDE